MTTDRRSRRRSADQEVRIDALKQQAKETAQGNLTSWESGTLSGDDKEQFWRSVVAFETAPLTNNFKQLAEAGLHLPEPDAVDDERLASTLRETIEALARLRVFIYNTNHLSDRELYTWLWSDALREEIPILPGDRGVWHVDVLGGCSEEDIELYLKYYADEEWRKRWLADFPDYGMPVHEDPPYDRDRFLPEPYEERP